MIVLGLVGGIRAEFLEGIRGVVACSAIGTDRNAHLTDVRRVGGQEPCGDRALDEFRATVRAGEVEFVHPWVGRVVSCPILGTQGSPISVASGTAHLRAVPSKDAPERWRTDGQTEKDGTNP